MTVATMTISPNDGHAYMVVGIPREDEGATEWMQKVEASSHVRNVTEAKGEGIGTDILLDGDMECALVIKFVKDGMIATSRVYREH